MNEETLKLITIACGLVAIIIIEIVIIHEIKEAIQTGRTGIQGWPDANRKSNPFWYWTCVLFYVALGTSIPIIIVTI